jgi:hypothetical protein
MRSSARRRVRTRSTGVISSSSVRIGLIWSADPSHACAEPIRPPRRRYSSVSIANHILSASRARETSSIASAPDAPEAMAFAAAITIIPWPPQAERLSQTWIRSPPLPVSISSWRAWRAESQVPEIPDEMWIETMSRPSASRGSYTEVKSPTDGCDVVAPPSLARRRS